MITREEYEAHLNDGEILIPSNTDNIDGKLAFKAFPTSTFKMIDILNNWEDYKDAFDKLEHYTWKKPENDL